MSQEVQVVTLSWQEGNEEEPYQLWDIQDNRGRLQWSTIETWFGSPVQIVGKGRPEVLKDGPWESFTADTFEAGSTILISVEQGTSISKNLPEMDRGMYSQAKEMSEDLKPRKGRTESAKAVTKAFSSASSSEAGYVLEHFGFTALNGQKDEPLQSPPTSIPEMPPFPFWEYPNKDAAAADFAKEHEKHLQSCGVKFDRGGFDVRDIHDETDLLDLPMGNTCFEGGLDCAIVPFAVMGISIASHLRVGFMHKQRQEHKEAFAAGHATKGSRQEGVKGSVLEDICPHAMIVLIAATYHNRVPLDLVLTDGEDNILLRFKEKFILAYTGLTRREAYYAVAERLKQDEAVKTKLGRVPDEELDQLDSALTEAHRVLRRKLGNPGEAFKEQLDSLLSLTDSPAERFQITYDLVYAWASNMKGDPLGLKKWYNS